MSSAITYNYLRKRAAREVKLQSINPGALLKNQIRACLLISRPVLSSVHLQNKMTQALMTHGGFFSLLGILIYRKNSSFWCWELRFETFNVYWFARDAIIKIPQTEWLNKISFPTVLEAGSQRSRCWQGCFLFLPFSWAHRWAFFCCVLSWPFVCAGASLMSLPVLIRAAVILN